jgi:hypothetical protein
MARPGALDFSEEQDLPESNLITAYHFSAEQIAPVWF